MSTEEPIRVRTETLTWRLVDGEVIVLDRRNWAYLSVNDSGAVLWQQLVHGATTPELAAALMAEFEVDEQSALRDAEAFVASLRERDLVVPG
jgi:hypothetical protein